MQELFTKLESEAHQLTQIAEEMHSVLRPGVGTLPNIDKNIVAHVESLAQSVADHQRLVSDILATNAESISDSLRSTAKKLDSIADAAKGQVTILDEALSYAQSQSYGGLSQRQLKALSETLTEKVVPMAAS